ncbi:MAG: hypothetical protein ACP5O2_07340 [Bacteroidales bacterium]
MKKTFFIFCLSLFVITSRAQNRTELGGNFGIQFGRLTLIEISPRLGYWFTDYLVGGVGTSLIFMDDDREGGFTGSIYSVSIFSRLYPAYNYYLQGEYVKVNTALPAGGGVVYRIWSEGLLLGVGYVQLLGGNSSLNVSLLWDVIGQKNFPYSNPIINAGIVTRF